MQSRNLLLAGLICLAWSLPGLSHGQTTETPAQEKAPPAQEKTDEAGGQDDAAAIEAAIKESKFDEAASLIAEAAKNEQSVGRFRQQLAGALARARKMDQAIEQLQMLVDEQIVGLDKTENLGGIVGSLGMLSMYSREPEMGKAAAETIERVVAAVESRIEADKYSPALRTGALVAGVKARHLANQGDSAGAEAVSGEWLKRIDLLFESDAENAELAGLKGQLMSQSLAMAEEDSAAEKFAALDSFLSGQIEKHPENTGLIGQFFASRSGRVARLLRADEEGADALLKETQTRLDALLKDGPESLRTNLEAQGKSLVGLARRIEMARRLKALVGQTAPPLDVAHWANGTGYSPADLTGKVVLLDFWAVWCGPCIATFPHLKHWHEDYASEGLRVVGVTRQYGYDWDEEADRAVKQEDEVAVEDELAMLDKFMTHHELKHPTIVTPEKSEMQTNFAVSGIPHAVLIDRKGTIRLIKVGSGEANAAELEAMIKLLLAEKE